MTPNNDTNTNQQAPQHGRNKKRTQSQRSSRWSRRRRPKNSSTTKTNKRKKRRKPLKVAPEVSKSVGAIVLNERNHVLLVFQQQNKYWEFPKGKVEGDETEAQTLRREIAEETGITTFDQIDGFRKSMYYEFQHEGTLIRREVVYYLIRTSARVRISDEHARFAWLPMHKAKKRLKHANQKALLDEVNATLNE